MSILIISNSTDIHANVIAKSIEVTDGIEVNIITANDFLQTNNLSINFNSSKVCLNEKDTTRSVFFSTWLRRLDPPSVDCYSDQENKFVTSEFRNYYFSTLRMLQNSGKWNVRFSDLYHASDKAVQLQIAKSVGLKIPETIISNSPKKILEFLNSSEQEYIYKPYRVEFWNGSQKATLTSKIEKPKLKENQVILGTSPGIYQRYLEKDYEVRVTFFDRYYIAAKLHSQEKKSTKLDWRMGQLNLDAERIKLPDDIFSKCCNLMSILKISHGCFDFIVKNGIYYFLEVNVTGNFLWLEKLDENEFPMTKICSAFLAHGMSGFSPELSDVDKYPSLLEVESLIG
ncbi:hypothetical protein J3L16_14950 [Alteromonas sp. 5E99-2]|uniref:hypothetical protein n=1 Tax=Alteromonas sp. 5E99-2 TaxID=2817683 RepID=UPI001A97F9C9|nr:hypothetical protein [Alteromonas sp. 5E99-2]MBO1256990.1 hypothetical protein [Alteromonas sp. 5E99-2]